MMLKAFGIFCVVMLLIYATLHAPQNANAEYFNANPIATSTPYGAGALVLAVVGLVVVLGALKNDDPLSDGSAFWGAFKVAAIVGYVAWALAVGGVLQQLGGM